MKKQQLCIAVFLTMSLVLMNVSTAFALPPQPSGFIGTAKVNGANVPPGTIISAWIDGVKYAEFPAELFSGETWYSLDVRGYDPDEPDNGGGLPGDTIVFRIGGLLALQSATWQSGTNILLNLTANEPTAVIVSSFTARAQPVGIQLTWQTLTEIDLLSFNLYRSETLDGPRLQLNPEQILATMPGSPLGADYTYLDTPVPGKMYYYWLEGITVSDGWIEAPISAGYFNIFMPALAK